MTFVRCRKGRERDDAPAATRARNSRTATVIVHGPCRVVWVDDTQVVATVVGSPEWPGMAPDVVRKPVPPLM